MKNIEKIIEKLNNLNTKAIQKPWYLEYKGRPLVLPSGKSRWKQKNHATSALTNALSNMYTRTENKKFEFNNMSEITKYLISTDIIKVKQLDT